MRQFKLGMEEREQNKKEDHESSDGTFMSVIKDFCGYTSAHGFERIMSAKQWIRKAFWSLLFIAAIIILGIQVYTLYNKYKARPLVTLVTLESDKVRSSYMIYSPPGGGGGGGTLPIVDYTGRLHPKGVPFSGWRYIKG